MQLTTLNAKTRTAGSSRDSGRSRRAGEIPAIYYGKGTQSVSISVSEKELEAVLAPGKRYTLLDLVINGKNGNPAIVHQYQKHNISQKIIHVDFLKIDENTPIAVRVPVHLSGIPIGVKNQGGNLSQESRYLKLLAKPSDIPASINLDISEMPNNITYYAEKLDLGKVSLLSPKRTVIFTISKGRDEAAEAAAATPAAAAAATPAPAAAAGAAAAKPAAPATAAKKEEAKPKKDAKKK
ncbi:LSU ribosomal protein L25p [Fibrobacteria bacterium R8-3-H12]